MDQIMLHAPWMPAGLLSAYHWNIKENFSKSANSNHFYFPLLLFQIPEY